jgi:hypothetical protein
VFGENPLHFGITNLMQTAPAVCRATPPERTKRLILDTAASEPRNSPSLRNKVRQKSIAVEVVGFSVPFFVSDSHASSEQLEATGLRLHEKH